VDINNDVTLLNAEDGEQRPYSAAWLCNKLVPIEIVDKLNAEELDEFEENKVEVAATAAAHGGFELEAFDVLKFDVHVESPGLGIEKAIAGRRFPGTIEVKYDGSEEGQLTIGETRVFTGVEVSTTKESPLIPVGLEMADRSYPETG